MAETCRVICPYVFSADTGAHHASAVLLVMPSMADAVTFWIEAEIPQAAPAPNLTTVSIIHPNTFSDAELQAIEALEDTMILEVF